MARRLSSRHTEHIDNDAAAHSQTSAEASLVSELTTPYAFLHPSIRIHESTIGTAKRFLDPLTISPSGFEATPGLHTRKRKRPGVNEAPANQSSRLQQLYVEDFTADQIWEQAVRILHSAGQGIERDYAQCTGSWPSHAQPVSPSASSNHDDSELPESSRVGSPTSDSLENSSLSSAEEADESVAAIRNSAHEEPESEDDGGVVEEGPSLNTAGESSRGPFPQDKFGLNDGFFSIDDFNKQSEAFERNDAKGSVNDVEDDEGIDWHADPLTQYVAPGVKDSMPAEVDGDVDDSDEDDEPAFGNADLHGESESGSEDSDDADAGMVGDPRMNTSDLKYSDFFGGSARPNANDHSRTRQDEPIAEDDVRRAAADVRRDLFEESLVEDEDASDNDLSDPRIQRSGHEKQRARIADEIRRLEAANVSRKDWMLAGEARAAERPVNSLIEEDLEFERVGKAVPVVTSEVSEGIEELVKRRILAREFDEVLRRHPGASGGQDVRKGRVELDDTKPQQSLAELYESDHLRASDPNYIDPKNQKLMHGHAEITRLWQEISSQLDTLSNWHYKPRAPQANINVVSDVGTITMEEARPTVGGTVHESAALAPQEIYVPGDGKTREEILAKSGAPISKEELDRETKAKLRRKHKKQKKSHGERMKRQTTKGAEQGRLVSDLQKGGVKVIGSQGEVTDVHGNKTRERQHGGDVLKL